MPTTATVTSSDPIRLLTLTSLYPSRVRPRHGIFVETRLRKLIETGRVDARVIAPVPWFPAGWPVFGRYASFARTPDSEELNGVRVDHPRYVVIPKLGLALQPRSMAWSASRRIDELAGKGFAFDVIDAHYFYPDGVAAAMLARRYGKPFTVTARGSDINLIAQLPGPRQMILAAARAAGRVVCVSASLARRMVELGVDERRISVLRNGVDLEQFKVEGQRESREHLGLPEQGKLALSVGNLVPEKGFDLAIKALQHLEDYRLLIVGEGPDRAKLEEQARKSGVAERLSIRSVVPQSQLRFYYSAADALLLTSAREGWPNVVLEALACGTPVVATDVGGVAEIISASAVGVVVPGRDSRTLASAVRRAVCDAPSRAEIRAYASRFGWEAVTDGQLRMFSSLLSVPAEKN